jgi:peptidoglycan/LPS O-acetylase OafA/YrhL
MTNRPQVCLASAVFRLYVCGLAVMTWFVAFFEERSLLALLKRTDEGAVILWMMLACGLVGIADVLINDTRLFPFRIESARTHRHFGFSGLAFCYVCQVFIAVLTIKSPWMAACSMWNAFLVVAFSLIDAHQRSKDSTCLQACS